MAAGCPEMKSRTNGGYSPGKSSSTFVQKQAKEAADDGVRDTRIKLTGGASDKVSSMCGATWNIY